MALKRNLDTRRNRDYWLFVQNTVETTNKWPEWKRLGEKAIPELRLLSDRRALLEGFISAVEEKLQNEIEKFKTVKATLLAEAKSYRKEIGRVERLIHKAQKKASKSEYPMETASRIVDSWSDSKRGAFEQRTGLKLSKRNRK